jgi:hypothetical protein
VSDKPIDTDAGAALVMSGRVEQARTSHHAGLGLMTPNQVHYGQATAIYAARQKTLDMASLANPERFVYKAPQPPAKPTTAWINPPTTAQITRA